MSQTFFLLTILCYFAATIEHLSYLAGRKNRLFMLATGSIILGFLLHTSALVLRSIETGHGPYRNMYEYTNFFSWTIVLIYLATELKYKIKDMGAFIMPLVLILTALATTFPRDISINTPVVKFWLITHITLSFCGYASFALTFGVGIMYLIQEKQLKSKKQGALYYRLPSLEILDNFNHKIISVGFILLTIGIITGSVWAARSKGSFFSWSPEKTLPMLLTWLIYTTLFVGRITVGWRGKKAAFFAIVGFFAVIVTYLLHIK